MTLTINSVLKVTAVQTYKNQVIENVYWYKAANTPAVGLDQFTAQFLSQVIDPVSGCQAFELMYTRITVEDITGDREFYDYAVPFDAYNGHSGATGDTTAPFLALEIKLTTASRLVRPGHKRFAGVLEGMMQSGGYLSPACLVELNAAGAAIIDGLTVDLVDLWNPVIVGFPHPAGEHSPARLTRVDVPITGYSPVTYVTTQNSRKYGHGT